ncbi:MAG: hypothetical protein N3A55_08440 [Methylohalobius sp.]|nr:hypothetical protein [Methylohalobius sp.]
MSGLAKAVLCLFGLGTALPAFAARPMITDDAGVVEAKACQVETWWQRQRKREEFWFQPACNFTGNLELSLGEVLVWESGQDHSLLVQAKSLFKALADDGWGIGWAAGGLVALNGKGADFYAYVPVSLALAQDRLLVHVNVGWQHPQLIDRHQFTWGAGWDAAVTEHAHLVAEVFGQDLDPPGYQAGVYVWVIADRLHLNATYGGWISGSHKPWVAIGVSWFSPPFWP